MLCLAAYERLTKLKICPEDVPIDTFLSIHNQNNQRYLRKNRHVHVRKSNLRRYKQMYENGHSIMSIALEVEFSPCMLARILLEYEWNMNKKKISTLMKDPDLIDDDRLRKDIIECIESDADCSPYSDRVRHTLGVKYEYILERKLRNRGIPYDNEDISRGKGLSKTPDALLKLPIGVKKNDGTMHVVHWIDSKAMFGDYETHTQENLAQLHGYVNRFGSGMVIYWFGYLETLHKTDIDVLVVNDFPKEVILPGNSMESNHLTNRLENDDVLFIQGTPCPSSVVYDSEGIPTTIVHSNDEK